MSDFMKPGKYLFCPDPKHDVWVPCIVKAKTVYVKPEDDARLTISLPEWNEFKMIGAEKYVRWFGWTASPNCFRPFEEENAFEEL